MAINPAVMSEVRRYRRSLVGSFMDENPEVFVRPTQTSCWVDLLCKYEVIPEPERITVDRVQGIISHVFRQAQHSLQSEASMRLHEFLSEENFPGIEEVEPDAMALMIVGGGVDDEYTPEAIAYGRTIAVFKRLVQAGAIPQDLMYESARQALDEIPGQTDFHRSLISMLKQMVCRDIDMMLYSNT